jgi:Na+-transporting NADH:ubiquinone oxidoreductase subunit C
MSEPEHVDSPDAAAAPAQEGIRRTLTVALVLCVVCSLVVSTAAVSLHPLQDANRARDRQRNILLAAGLYDPQQPLADLIKHIETRWVDIDQGRFVDNPGHDALEEQEVIPGPHDLAGIKTRPRYSEVYLVHDGNRLRSVILPIWGLGLYSTLHGFVALAGDGSTVQGIRFYEHGETPGLGGQVDSPRWLALWPGKRIYADDDAEPRLKLVKGGVDPHASDAVYKVDALTGATLTSRGVTHMIEYWFGDDGYGPFLKGLHNSEA